MKKFIISINWFFGRFIIYIPLSILAILGVGYSYLLIASPISLNRFQFLIGLDAAIATLAGLSFYASYTSQDKQRKNSYFECGESLFHSFILIFIATFLRGCFLFLDQFPGYNQWQILVRAVIVFTIIIFFLYGLYHLITGLKRLLCFINKITMDKYKKSTGLNIN